MMITNAWAIQLLHRKRSMLSWNNSPCFCGTDSTNNSVALFDAFPTEFLDRSAAQPEGVFVGENLRRLFEAWKCVGVYEASTDMHYGEVNIGKREGSAGSSNGRGRGDGGGGEFRGQKSVKGNVHLGCGSGHFAFKLRGIAAMRTVTEIKT